MSTTKTILVSSKQTKNLINYFLTWFGFDSLLFHSVYKNGLVNSMFSVTFYLVSKGYHQSTSNCSSLHIIVILCTLSYKILFTLKIPGKVL